MRRRNGSGDALVVVRMPVSAQGVAICAVPRGSARAQCSPLCASYSKPTHARKTKLALAPFAQDFQQLHGAAVVPGARVLGERLSGRSRLLPGVHTQVTTVTRRRRKHHQSLTRR